VLRPDRPLAPAYEIPMLIQLAYLRIAGLVIPSRLHSVSQAVSDALLGVRAKHV